jgi:hypothetical protein
MMLYGNPARLENAASVAASISTLLRRAGSMPSGIDRHAVLAHAFIRAGELVQGIADAEFDRCGVDARSRMQDKGATLLLAMAVALDRSWRSNFREELSDIPLSLLRQLGSAGWISTRVGEGYAHYALYPEAYLEAARRSGLGSETLVIGIRSIGTSLGALVAAALQARPAISLRPVGHPFRREIRAEPGILTIAASDSDLQFAVVDEGPGMSGSSFASVARWLFDLGIGPAQIHFFSSHGNGPGEAAGRETRAIWQGCRHHPALSCDFFDQTLKPCIESRLGSLEGALKPYSPTPSTPRDGRFERLKFSTTTTHGRLLVKFAGLGDSGERKLRDAQTLATEGFSPGVVGLCYGFLLQEHATARRLGCTIHDRARFLQTLASYLSFRAGGGLGPAGPGATVDTLRRMAIENSLELLGPRFASTLECHLQRLSDAGAPARVVRTDNRLQSWKWLVTSDGFLKVDAVDHCEAHDLVGCQDIAWDIAGSIVEYRLSAAEAGAICNAIRSAGGNVEPHLIATMLPCYLAFQSGLWGTATGAAAEALARSYVHRLKSFLHLLPQYESQTRSNDLRSTPAGTAPGFTTSRK